MLTGVLLKKPYIGRKKKNPEVSEGTDYDPTKAVLGYCCSSSD